MEMSPRYTGWPVFLGLLALMALLLLASCRTRRTAESESLRDEGRRTAALVERSHTGAVRLDSVHITDSVRVAGDTVYRYRGEYRSRAVHDTVWASRTDTLRITRTVTRTVTVSAKRPLTLWQRVCLWGFPLLLAGVLLWRFRGALGRWLRARK